MKVRPYAAVACMTLAFAGFLVLIPSIGAAQELHWKRVFGIQQTFDLVGSGTGQVEGGAPWETIGGSVDISLKNDKVNFSVKGLILAVGSVPSLKMTGLPIGTTAGVSSVRGTLVCNVDGSANSGNSVLFDTSPIGLDLQGNAHFSGSFLNAPTSLCDTLDNDAFLIRIVEPTSFANLWIAFGAVPTSSSCTPNGDSLC
jgi:hypothetical protein